jgi:hypothetical protein
MDISLSQCPKEHNGGRGSSRRHGVGIDGLRDVRLTRRVGNLRAGTERSEAR